MSNVIAKLPLDTFELHFEVSDINPNTGFIYVVNPDGTQRDGNVVIMEARALDNYTAVEAARAFYVHTFNTELQLDADERSLARMAISEQFPDDGFFGGRSACHIDSMNGTDTRIEVEREDGEVVGIVIGITRNGNNLRCRVDLSNGPVNFTRTILNDTKFMMGLSDLADDIWNQQA